MKRTTYTYALAALAATGVVFTTSSADNHEKKEKAKTRPGTLQTVPDEADLAKLTKDKVAFIDRLLSVVEKEIVPLTQKGVRGGSKVFGGAVLKKDDLSTVVAVTNNEVGNPLHHGEISTINAFYGVPRDKRPASKDTIFLTTHEPCPLCLAGITWGGWNNFFYLFSYEDSKDAFNIPHDIRINEEIWRVDGGEYNQKNHYWNAFWIQDIIATCEEKDQERLNERIAKLKKAYAEMSEIYQKSKSGDAEIPLP